MFPAVWGAMALVLLAAGNSAASYSNQLNPETGRPYNEIIVGGMANAGREALFSQWNATFSE